jgi:hypothetical protein
MTREYTKLAMQPQPASRVTLEDLSATERSRVQCIDIPPQAATGSVKPAALTPVHYLEGHEADAVQAFLDCNWAALCNAGETTITAVESHLSAPQRNWFSYYRAFQEFKQPRKRKTMGIPETYLRSMSPEDGSLWVFDSEAYEQWQVTDARVIDAGARFPADPPVDVLTPMPTVEFGPSDAWEAGICGDIEVIYRYCLYNWGRQYSRTVVDGTDVLVFDRGRH